MVKVLMRADTHVNININGDEPRAKCTWSQVMAALSVSLGSMVVGYASGYSSPALVSLKEQDKNGTLGFYIDDELTSWIGGLMPLAALVGGIAGGPLIEYIGRKGTILGTAVPFIVCKYHVGRPPGHVSTWRGVARRARAERD